MTQPTPPADDLSCQELVELVTEYLEGAMAPPDRARFDEHLGVCEGCRTYLDQMRATIRVVGSIDPAALDPSAERALLAAFRDWKR